MDRRVFFTGALAVTLPAAARATPAGLVTVFAAASLTNAVDEIGAAFHLRTGLALRSSYAASSVLARQIISGAPADVFVSADEDWMDAVAKAGLVRAGSRRDLLGNQLVLITQAVSAMRPEIRPGFPLASYLRRGRLAVGDPSNVPAGKYAEAALRTLGVWDSVKDHLAPAENVRAALQFVARGEAPYGIVYRTDALADPRVDICDTFPASSHPPIRYPAAVLKSADAGGPRFAAFLRSAEARAIFTRLGFKVF